VIRKFTGNRKLHPNENTALMIVYMAIREASTQADHATPSPETGQQLLHPV
jgi:hypothetical protein